MSNYDEDIAFERIVSIEYNGVEQVYDIAVSGTHNFVANGIIAHNTYLTGGLGVGLLNTTSGTVQTSGLITGGSTLTLSGTTGTTTLASGQGFTIGSSQFVLQQGSGNVGIGTTAPLSGLQVVTAVADAPATSGVHLGMSGNYAAMQLAGNTAGGGFIDFSNAASRDYDFREIYTGSTNNLTFRSSSTNPILTLLGTGNVGIGTANPRTSLEVYGTASTTALIANTVEASPGAYTLLLRNIGGTNRIDSYNNPITVTVPLAVNASTMDFLIADVVKMTLNSSGNLVVNGSATTCTIGNGTSATNCTSDSRLKTNIVDISGDEALQKLSLIRSVTFNWADPSKDQQQRVGIIAQDVQAAFPQVVGSATTTFNGVAGNYLTVDYAALVSPLISGVNYLNLNLETIASTTASTTPASQSFAGSFFKNLFARVVAWFADAGNGITDLFAKNIYATNIKADEVDTKRLCLEDVCVTKAELQALLLQSASAAVPSGGGSGGDPPSSGQGSEPPPPDTTPPTDTSTSTDATDSTTLTTESSPQAEPPPSPEATEGQGAPVPEPPPSE